MTSLAGASAHDQRKCRPFVGPGYRAGNCANSKFTGYPTLREGEFPRSAAEFTRLFVYGLPKDSFIYGGATSLKVHESVDSDTLGTLYLVSVGPYKPPDGNYANVPDVIYDPTNGVMPPTGTTDIPVGIACPLLPP